MKFFLHVIKIPFLLFIFFVLAFPIASYAQKLIPPKEGIYHAAYPDFEATAGNVSAERIYEFEELARKKIVWAYFSNHWFDGIRFPRSEAETIRDAGRIPYIRMMPWSEEREEEQDPVYKLENFLSGKFDDDLTLYAIAARDFRSPLLIEFGPEVNGDWFPWNGRWNGGGVKDKYGDPLRPDGPERYRDTYRRIINIFRRVGANNVTWVFHVDSQWEPEAWWNRIHEYYPGGSYIDWIGVSVFGAQLPTHDWQEFADVLRPVYRDIVNMAPSKPIAIAEYGVIEAPNLGSKARWFHNLFSSLHSFPNIKALSYWNSPGWLENGSANFRIDSSTEALRAYREGISNRRFVSQPRFHPQ